MNTQILLVSAFMLLAPQFACAQTFPEPHPTPVNPSEVNPSTGTYTSPWEVGGSTTTKHCKTITVTYPCNARIEMRTITYTKPNGKTATKEVPVKVEDTCTGTVEKCD